MAATNWTIITRRKDNGKIVTFPLLSKWTYKTAIAIANETMDTNTFEIICIVEIREEVSNKRDYFIIVETTIKKAFKIS